MIVKVIGFDHGITCSGICRGSSSTLCVRKRQIRVIHYLRLSIGGLKDVVAVVLGISQAKGRYALG